MLQMLSQDRVRRRGCFGCMNMHDALVQYLMNIFYIMLYHDIVHVQPIFFYQWECRILKLEL